MSVSRQHWLKWASDWTRSRGSLQSTRPNRCDGRRADTSSTPLLCNHIAHGHFDDPPYFVAPRHTAQRRGQPAGGVRTPQHHGRLKLRADRAPPPDGVSQRRVPGMRRQVGFIPTYILYNFLIFGARRGALIGPMPRRPASIDHRAAAAAAYCCCGCDVMCS